MIKVALAFVATTGICSGIYLILFDSRRWRNRYHRACCTDIIKQRRDAIVDPDDTDAFFLGIVPRDRWGGASVELASDIGFLRLDSAKKQVLFEGCQDRWILPADAIRSCLLEDYIEAQGTAVARCRKMLVLQVRHPDVAWQEIALALREEGGLLNRKRFEKKLGHLCDLIREIR